VPRMLAAALAFGLLAGQGAAAQQGVQAAQTRITQKRDFIARKYVHARNRGDSGTEREVCVCGRAVCLSIHSGRLIKVLVLAQLPKA